MCGVTWSVISLLDIFVGSKRELFFCTCVLPISYQSKYMMSCIRIYFTSFKVHPIFLVYLSLTSNNIPYDHYDF